MVRHTQKVNGATYNWFCVDGSHMFLCLLSHLSYSIASHKMLLVLNQVQFVVDHYTKETNITKTLGYTTAEQRWHFVATQIPLNTVGSAES